VQQKGVSTSHPTAPLSPDINGEVELTCSASIGERRIFAPPYMNNAGPTSQLHWKLQLRPIPSRLSTWAGFAQNRTGQFDTSAN